ncbi:hypothetical protein P3W45_000161 [Vairimorpha bombi]|jgi:amino acid permease
MYKESIDTYAAISLLVTSMMGTGITFMPYAFNSMGYYGSWSILIFVGIGTFFSLLCISYVVKKKGDKYSTYTSLAEDVSTREYYFVSLSIFFNCYFSNIAFYRFLTDILIDSSSILRNISSNPETSRKIVALLLFPFLLYMSLKKELVNLKFTSLLATASVTLLSLLVIFYSITLGSKVYDSDTQAFNTNFKYGVPFFIPCMVCQPSMVEVVQKLENKSWRNIFLVSFAASLSGFLIYGLVGHCGYIIFGRSIEGHILKEFTNSDSKLNVYIQKNTLYILNILPRLAVYSMICLLGFGFPVQMVPVTDMFMQFIYKENINDIRKSVMTTILFCVCFCLVLVENLRIKFIKRVSGAIFSTSVGLIHPFIYYLNSVEPRKITSMVPSTICGITGCVIFYIICTLILDLFRGDPELFN